MLTSVAWSFMRNGRNVFFSHTKIPLVSALKDNAALTRLRRLSHRSSEPLAPTPRRSCGGPAAGYGTSLPGPVEGEPPEHDTFGSLSTDMSSRRSFRKTSPYLQDLRHREEEVVEEEEEGPVESRRRYGRRNTPYWYFLQCKKLIKENKLQEALDMFSRDMLQGERLQPEEFNYTVLIGGCGRAGQMKKAFRLYNDMKKRGLEGTDATYTALFNACAEAPSKRAGLQQALKLEQELRRRSYPLSTVTYHALLKTHAVANHLQACVHTLREMLQEGHAVTQETFHHLLMGCLKDKQTGFTQALKVWRQMLSSRIAPDSRNYNLLLRIARDCAIGDAAVASVALLSPVRVRERRPGSRPGAREVVDIDLLERQLLAQPDPVGDGGDELHDTADSSHLVPVRQTVSLPVDPAGDRTAPNLLDLFEGKRTGVISLGTVGGASDRLALVGGAEGVLEKMEASGLGPDLRTLTLLADMMEPGHQSLQVLLKAAKQHRVKLDTAFYNSAIRRAARAGDAEGAKAALSLMRQRNVNVDMQTFGCLALGCERLKDGQQLLADMEEAGLKPNVYVFSALIGRATRRLDYVYLKAILKSMSSMGVGPNEVIVKQLEFASQYPPNYDQYKSRNNYLVHVDGFRGYYQQWLREMPAQSPEDERAALQPQAVSTALTAEAPDGETERQRNQKAAARRYKSRN